MPKLAFSLQAPKVNQNKRLGYSSWSEKFAPDAKKAVCSGWEPVVPKDAAEAATEKAKKGEDVGSKDVVMAEATPNGSPVEASSKSEAGAGAGKVDPVVLVKVKEEPKDDDDDSALKRKEGDRGVGNGTSSTAVDDKKSIQLLDDIELPRESYPGGEVEVPSGVVYQYIHGSYRKFAKRKREQNMRGTVDRTLMDRLKTKHVEMSRKGKRPRQSVLDSLDDLKVSLTMNVYPHGFGIVEKRDGEDYVKTIHQYSRSTRQLLEGLDRGQMREDILRAVRNPTYYDGGIVVEVRDFMDNARSELDTAPLSGMNFDKPKPGRVYRVFVRQGNDMLFYDLDRVLAQSRDLSTTEMVLEAEKKIILKTAPPVCLDPSTNVARVNNLIQYNNRKYSHLMLRKLKEDIVPAYVAPRPVVPVEESVATAKDSATTKPVEAAASVSSGQAATAAGTTAAGSGAAAPASTGTSRWSKYMSRLSDKKDEQDKDQKDDKAVPQTSPRSSPTPQQQPSTTAAGASKPASSPEPTPPASGTQGQAPQGSPGVTPPPLPGFDTSEPEGLPASSKALVRLVPGHSQRRLNGIIGLYTQANNMARKGDSRQRDYSVMLHQLITHMKNASDGVSGHGSASNAANKSGKPPGPPKPIGDQVKLKALPQFSPGDQNRVVAERTVVFEGREGNMPASSSLDMISYLNGNHEFKTTMGNQQGLHTQRFYLSSKSAANTFVQQFKALQSRDGSVCTKDTGDPSSVVQLPRSSQVPHSHHPHSNNSQMASVGRGRVAGPITTSNASMGNITVQASAGGVSVNNSVPVGYGRGAPGGRGGPVTYSQGAPASGSYGRGAPSGVSYAGSQYSQQPVGRGRGK